MLDINLYTGISYTWENFKKVIRGEIMRMELPFFTLFYDTQEYQVNNTGIKTYRQLVALLTYVDSVAQSSSSSEMQVTAVSTSTSDAQLPLKLGEIKPVSYSALEQGLPEVETMFEGVITLLTQSLLDSQTPDTIIPFLRAALAYAHLIQAFQQKTLGERLAWLNMQDALSNMPSLERITLAFILNDATDIYALALQAISLSDYYWYVENTSYHVNIMERAILKGNVELALFFKAMGVHFPQTCKPTNIYVFHTYCDPNQNQDFNEDILDQVKRTKQLLSDTAFKYHTPIIYDIINDVAHFTADNIIDPRLTPVVEVLTKKVVSGVWCFIYPALLNPMLLQVLTYVALRAARPLTQISNPSILENTLRYIIEHVHQYQGYTLASLFMRAHDFQGFASTVIPHLLSNMPSDNKRLAHLIFAILPPTIDEVNFEKITENMLAAQLLPYDDNYRSRERKIQGLILLMFCGLANNFDSLLNSNIEELPSTSIFKLFATIYKSNISQESLSDKALKTIYRTQGFAGIPNSDCFNGYKSYHVGNPLVVSMMGLWRQSNIAAPQIQAKVEEALGDNWVDMWSSFCNRPLENSDLLLRERGHHERFTGLHIFDELEKECKRICVSKFFNETYQKLRATYKDIPLGFLVLAFAMMKDISTLKLSKELQPLQQEWQIFSTLPNTLPKSLIFLVEQGEKLICPKHPLQPLLRTLLFLEQATTLGDKTTVEMQQAQLVKVYHKLLTNLPEHVVTNYRAPASSSSL